MGDTIVLVSPWSPRITPQDNDENTLSLELNRQRPDMTEQHIGEEGRSVPTAEHPHHYQARWLRPRPSLGSGQPP